MPGFAGGDVVGIVEGDDHALAVGGEDHAVGEGVFRADVDDDARGTQFAGRYIEWVSDQGFCGGIDIEQRELTVDLANFFSVRTDLDRSGVG